MADEKIDTYTDEQAEKDFTEGFTAPETKTPPVQAEVKTDPAITEPPAEEVIPPVEEPVVEHIQLTKAQFDRLTAAADKTDGFDAKLDKLFGSVGGVQQIVKELQAATPKGLKVEIPEDAVAEMAVDYPEIAAHFRKALEKSLKGVSGTGSDTPAAAAKADPEEIARIVKADFQKHQSLALEDEHPGWRQIVGTVDRDGKFDEKQPFRVWLAKQPAAYQTKINGTDSASVISKAIDRYKTETAKKPVSSTPQAQVRKDRIRDAVQPRGAGGNAPAADSEEAAFEKGFRTG